MLYKFKFLIDKNAGNSKEEKNPRIRKATISPTVPHTKNSKKNQ